MLIQMRTTAAGPDGVLSLGKVYDLPPDKARPWIDAEVCFPVRLDEKGKPVRIEEERKPEPVVKKNG